MVGSRILTDDHNDIGLLKIRQANGSFSNANGASEGFPA